MKKYSSLILAGTLALIAGSLIGGCTSLFTPSSSPTSLPVQAGNATTNTPPSVAWLQEAQAVNAAINPTPTEPLVNTGIGALIALASAISGWVMRHKATPTTTVTAANSTTQVKS